MFNLLSFEQSEMLKKIQSESLEYASLNGQEIEIVKFLKQLDFVKFTGKSKQIYQSSYAGRKTHKDKVIITMLGTQYLASEQRFIESEQRSIEASKRAKIATFIAIFSLLITILQFTINDLLPLL